MYHIGICDDKIHTCFELEQMARVACADLNVESTIEVWCSGNSLLDYIKSGNGIDLLFLDIELPDIDGICVGKYIREEKSDIYMRIAYISSKSNYVMELFNNHPIAFLIKPIKMVDVRNEIRKGLESKKRHKSTFTYKKGHGTYIVNCKDIMYLSSDRKEIVIVFGDGRTDRFYGRLGEISKMLPDNFSIIHKSHIVNRDYIKHFYSEAVQMTDGNRLAVSKQYRGTVQLQNQI